MVTPPFLWLISYLCLTKSKNLWGCYVGGIIVLPMAIFEAITIGLVLGGGWTAELIGLFGLKTGIVSVMLIMIGSAIGFLLVFLAVLVIGINIGNFIGNLISKMITG